MQAPATPEPTEVLSASTGRPALVIPDGLDYEQWGQLGARVIDANKSAMFMLGDWLAYGHRNFAATHWGNRVPTELYERLSLQTGYAIQTLQNAKVVCVALPPSRRREGLTFNQAVEIVGRAAPKDVDRWIERAVTDGLTTKTLREQLRRSTASSPIEVNDTGTQSFLEIARQFARDYNTARSTFSPALCHELRKVLAPVIADFEQR